MEVFSIQSSGYIAQLFGTLDGSRMHAGDADANVFRLCRVRKLASQQYGTLATKVRCTGDSRSYSIEGETNAWTNVERCVDARR